MLVERITRLGVVFVNISETDKNRLSKYIEFYLDEKKNQGIPDIYEFIFKNLSKPEWYIVQLQNNEYIIQKLGKQ